MKVVLDRIGDMRWMQVAIRPAKPFAFGVVGGRAGVRPARQPGVVDGVASSCSPGPALRQMMGYADATSTGPRCRAVADEDLRRRPDGKVHFVRVVAALGDDGRCHVRSAGGQGSHQLAAMAAANALAVLPDGDGVAAGGDVDVLLLT